MGETFESIRLSIAAVAISVYFAGCAGTTMAPAPSTTAPKQDQGVIVLSVTGNTGQVQQVDHVTLRRRDPQGKSAALQMLKNVAPGLARDTALFIGVVPAGDYSLDQLHSGTQYLALGEAGREMLGIFRVHSGHVTDLGRVVMTPVNTRVVTGRSTKITSNAELIKGFAADNASILSMPAGGGWSGPRSERDRVEEYALQSPVGANTPIELKSGEILAASRLGTILIRNTLGRWRGARTGQLNSLLAIIPVDGNVDGVDAVAVAVGELNTIVRVENNDKLSLLNAGNLPPGNLLSIAGNSAAGWFVAQAQGERVVLYRSPTLDDGDWKELRSENIAFSFWSGVNAFWMWRTDRGFAYAISEGRIHHYDFASGAWTDVRAPKNDRLVSIAANGDHLGILTSPGGGMAGLFASMYASHDGGAIWEAVNPPYKVKQFAPRVLNRNKMLVAGGGMYAKEELRSSEDGGKTWKLLSTDVDAFDDIVVLPSGAMLAIRGGQYWGLATIRHSADGGATWKLEYSNFDRQVYERRKR